MTLETIETIQTCRVVTPPANDACGKRALYRITFRDGDVTTACKECMLTLGQLAGSHGATIKAERIR